MCIHIYTTALIIYKFSVSKEAIENKFLKEDGFASLGNQKLLLEVENYKVVNMLPPVGKSTRCVPILPNSYNIINNSISDIQVSSSYNREFKIHNENIFEIVKKEFSGIEEDEYIYTVEVLILLFQI